MKTFAEINIEASAVESNLEQATIKEIFSVWVISLAILTATATVSIAIGKHIASVAGLS